MNLLLSALLGGLLATGLLPILVGEEKPRTVRVRWRLRSEALRAQYTRPNTYNRKESFQAVKEGSH